MDEYEKSKMCTKRYKKLKTLLKNVFGYHNFREKQYEIINRIINGEDVCAIMSTGAGKSLCFQIPALYLDRPAVIVSPLISLMDDQRLILEDLGISSCCYNSTVQDKSKMRKDILKGEYQFIYITPETIVHLKDFLVKLEKIQGISLFAIDEAHCISSYGFDFRKSYRELSFLKDILPNVPILAVTATATPLVGKDICKVLGFENKEPIKTSFDRPNLYLEVRKKSTRESLKAQKRKIDPVSNDIIPILEKHPNQSTIIYCLTKKETKLVSDILNMHNIKCSYYHAELSHDVKMKAHHDFLKGNVKIIAATIAFGMGINKPDVRVVIHYGSPKNIEGYYQEIGRAGRDGNDSYCYAFFSRSDFVIQENFISQINNTTFRETQKNLLKKMKMYMETKQCRRQILLEYFGEDAPNKCNKCDNCCGVHEKEVEVKCTKQDVQKEAKMLIELMESLDRSFGICMYINILRGSNSKTITPTMRKSKFYGKGKHRSTEWWKEMSENLIKQGFLQQVFVRSSRFPMQTVRPTNTGLKWAALSDLSGYLDGLAVPELENMQMVTAI